VFWRWTRDAFHVGEVGFGDGYVIFGLCYFRMLVLGTLIFSASVIPVVGWSSADRVRVP
jgi:hypothetical protein